MSCILVLICKFQLSSNVQTQLQHVPKILSHTEKNKNVENLNFKTVLKCQEFVKKEDHIQNIENVSSYFHTNLI